MHRRAAMAAEKPSIVIAPRPAKECSPMHRSAAMAAQQPGSEVAIGHRPGETHASVAEFYDGTADGTT